MKKNQNKTEKTQQNLTQENTRAEILIPSEENTRQEISNQETPTRETTKEIPEQETPTRETPTRETPTRELQQETITETAKELPKEITKETSIEIPKQTPKEISTTETPQEIQQEIQQKIQQEVLTEKIPKEVPQETPQGICTTETPKEITKETPKDIPTLNEQKPPPNLTPEEQTCKSTEEIPKEQSNQPILNKTTDNTTTSTSLHATDDRWWIKQILWPPFPTDQNNQNPRTVSILMQNLNGPCSLLAICNILLLRGSIVLPGPGTRTTISYGTLTAILADYLMSRIEPGRLDGILSVIPRTQTGLDLNPCFNSIDAFRPTSNSDSDALDLFKAASIRLIHGWVADPQDLTTWNVISNHCSDYDKIVQFIATGDALMSKKEPVDPHEQSLIKDSLIARQFLETTSTQLSYYGLFQLSSELGYDSTAVFLRNSHLSVIYHRPNLKKRRNNNNNTEEEMRGAFLPPPPDQIDADYDHETALEVHAITQHLQANDNDGSQLDHDQDEEDDDSNLPKLFTLVTDLSFLNQPQIVWESLQDIDGGLCEFYDWNLRKCPSRNFAQNLPTRLPTCSSHSIPNTNADFDLAKKLQQEEYKKASIREREAEEERRRRTISNSNNNNNNNQKKRVQVSGGHGRYESTDHSQIGLNLSSSSSTTTTNPNVTTSMSPPLNKKNQVKPSVSSKKKHKDCLIV